MKYSALVSVMLLVLFVPVAFGQSDPEINLLRFTVIKGPDNALFATQTEVNHVWSSMSVPMDVDSPILIGADGAPRVSDIEKLEDDGFLVKIPTGPPAFSMQVVYVAFNIRDTATIQSYYRPEITYWPLHDVEFRHALVHCYDQLDLIPAIYGYAATPVRSLVPPAQSRYYNPAVPEHPYNPGDPFTSPAGEHSACGILKAAGYTFVDADSSGAVTNLDYWNTPDGGPLPLIQIMTPLVEVAPTSQQHVLEFVRDLKSIGLAANSENGMHGLVNYSIDFSEMLSLVYEQAEFDAYIVYTDFGRIWSPGQLYSLLHSSQDCLIYPSRSNAPGVHDPTIDTLCDEVKFSLDSDDTEMAAKEVQQMMYTTTEPGADNFALAYMCMFFDYHFSAYHPDLRGIVKSWAYGSDNKWTFLNINWAPGTERTEDGKTLVVWALSDEPETCNPLRASTKNEWEVLGRSYDGLTSVNPYNLNDIPWLASSWSILQTASGMELNFTLREDVYWQDGYQFTAYDVEFCLEFVRDYQVPRYAETWGTLIDVVVTDATHLTILVNKAGFDLFYDYANLAAMLPPQIWDKPWVDTQAILDYDPTEPYNVASGYTPGPSPTPTNLFGTGQWIFQFYDALNEFGDVWKNPNYFMSTPAIDDLMADLFGEVGDINRDGIINVIDLTLWSLSYGRWWYEPGYNAAADLNSDGIVDFRDGIRIAYRLLWQREYP
jgi:peptide/nickel transport system substrate-binding protein